MKVFLSVVSVMIVLLGFGWLFFPDTMLGSWSVQTDAIGVYVAQRYGGALSGYAAILWLARTAGSSSARAAIFGGGAFVTGLMTVLSLAGVITGAVGPGAWGAVVVEALLAGSFLHCYLAERTQAEAKASW